MHKDRQFWKVITHFWRKDVAVWTSDWDGTGPKTELHENPVAVVSFPFTASSFMQVLLPQQQQEAERVGLKGAAEWLAESGRLR